MKEKNKNIQIPVVIKSNNSKDKKVKFIIILAVIWSINQIAINNGASDSIGLIR